MTRPGRNKSTEQKKRTTYYLPVSVINMLAPVYNKSYLIEQLIIEWHKTKSNEGCNKAPSFIS